MSCNFPPNLAVGCRVWTNTGYHDHGPMEGPKVDIQPNMGGVVIGTSQRMDFALYSVRWDNGQLSKHYHKALFSIGKFANRDEFEAAIKFVEDVQILVGPRGGFRGVMMQVEYDGELREGRLGTEDRNVWFEFYEPIAKRQGIKIRESSRLSRAY